MMNVAFTVWEDRISPVFDAAHDLMIAVVDDRCVKEKRFFSFDPDRVATLIGMLRHDAVDVLVCGAISETPARLISESGIRLIPFISGNVDLVLTAFAQGRPLAPVFLMPGCGRVRPMCGRRIDCPRAASADRSGKNRGMGQDRNE
jgi:predicted Fe-Mo cluster-binding NifX family protein